MLYIMLYTSVLAVRDNELNVRDDEVASSGVAELGKRAGKHGDADPVSRPRFTGDGDLILIYNYYIHILCINTNLLIYICHILCYG